MSLVCDSLDTVGIIFFFMPPGKETAASKTKILTQKKCILKIMQPTPHIKYCGFVYILFQKRSQFGHSDKLINQK